MADILDPELSIQIDRATGITTISVRCDLGFTDSEVTRMNVFGRSYTLECCLLHSLAPDADTVLSFDSQVFPRFRDGANRYEHPKFEVLVETGDLDGHTMLVAELTLSNEDRGTVDVKRTQSVRRELAAGNSYPRA